MHGFVFFLIEMIAWWCDCSRGTLYAFLGVVIGVVATYPAVEDPKSNAWALVISFVPSLAIGAFVASRVSMTALPVSVPFKRDRPLGCFCYVRLSISLSALCYALLASPLSGHCCCSCRHMGELPFLSLPFHCPHTATGCGFSFSGGPSSHPSLDRYLQR